MLNEKETALIIIDVQGKLARMVAESEQLVKNLRQLISAFKTMSIPIVWVEQYPEGLGKTIPEISELLVNQTPFSKYTFSALGNKDIENEIEKLNRKQWLVCGIETHICVYQTAMDLLAKNYEVEIVSDAVSSRTKESKALALSKLQKKGVGLTNIEMCVYELIKNSKTDIFKKILPLFK